MENRLATYESCCSSSEIFAEFSTLDNQTMDLVTNEIVTSIGRSNTIYLSIDMCTVKGGGRNNVT